MNGSNVLPLTVGVPAMTPQAIDRVRALETRMREVPDQVPITTHHLIHAGLYARTIRIPAGVVLTGALIKRATVLVVNGHATVHVGDGSIELAGYQVIPASAGRKQAFFAHEDTDLTMLFPSQAETVEAAEAEFTDEVDLLFSRNGAPNTITITGE